MECVKCSTRKCKSGRVCFLFESRFFYTDIIQLESDCRIRIPEKDFTSSRTVQSIRNRSVTRNFTEFLIYLLEQKRYQYKSVCEGNRKLELLEQRIVKKKRKKEKKRKEEKTRFSPIHGNLRQVSSSTNIEPYFGVTNYSYTTLTV